jgi:hypothetical protein
VASDVRITFVGQSTYFESCSLMLPFEGLSPSFVDFRVGDDPKVLRYQLEQVQPHIIIVFKPETIEPGLMIGLDAVRVGWFTEPLPRATPIPLRHYGDGQDESAREQREALQLSASRDLARRLESAKSVDPNNFDRLISYDPLIVPTLQSFVDIWRAQPLPLDDSFFQDVRTSQFPPKVSFFGRPTVHRDFMLGPSLHSFDVRYIAHGIFGTELRDMLFSTDIGINLHNERYPNFENRVAMHLAAGNLLVSEPLSPTHGLEPGIDFFEIRTPQELFATIEELRSFPDQSTLMRIRGRQKAEYFRASTVFAALVRELL